MAFHFIAIKSDYTDGIRIGWHYSEEGKLKKEIIQGFTAKVKERCGSVPLAIHKFATDDKSWDSVVKKDAFFKDVVVTEDIDSFIDMVSIDQKLTAYDVSKFILSVTPISHLKLQKLLYLSYAEYLIRTGGKKLFKEPIIAYKYGPVVESIFQKFKVHGSSIIDFIEDGESKIRIDDIAVTPTFMKIASSKNGMTAMDCILKVIREYYSYSAYELVQLTHKKGGPWHRVYKQGKNSIIHDDLILKYHHILKSS